MSEIVVVGSLRARPGKEDETREALGGLVAPTHAEDGCILYSLHQGIADKTRFAFVERWESQQDLDVHLSSDHISALVARADELLSEPQGEEHKGSLAAHAG